MATSVEIVLIVKQQQWRPLARTRATQFVQNAVNSRYSLREDCVYLTAASVRMENVMKIPASVITAMKELPVRH